MVLRGLSSYEEPISRIDAPGRVQAAMEMNHFFAPALFMKVVNVLGYDCQLGLLWKAKTGSVTVDGPCKMTSTQLEFPYSGEHHWGWVDLAKPTNSLLGHRLNTTDCRALTKELKPKMQEIWERAEVLDEGSRRIQLGALSEILRAGA